MTMLNLALILILLASAFGAWRSLRLQRRRGVLPAVLQLLAGIALMALIAPPDWPGSGRTLRVFTAHAGAEANLPAADVRVALPEAEASDATLVRVPDLATALRRFEGIGRVQVLGDGLPARDQDSVAGLALDWHPGPEPVGVIELEVPGRVVVGRNWTIRGRVSGIEGARVILRDRGGAEVARTEVETAGTFRLDLASPVIGAERYVLQLVDAKANPVESVPIDVVIEAGAQLHVVSLAAAPDAELKYLRRWAEDAGHDLASRIVLSPGIEQRQGTIDLAAAALAAADLLIVDDRSWAALDAAQKAAIDAAVREGLGLLLRVGANPSKATLADWSALGVPLEARTENRAQSLGVHIDGEALELTPPALQLASSDAASLLVAQDGRALVAWHTHGLGRIGAWLPQDSYQWQLQGHGRAHASLWSRTFSTLARSGAEAGPDLPAWITVGQRSLLCGLQAPASMRAADGSVAELRVADSGCAYWWPAAAGWHILVSADARSPVSVHARDDGETLTRQATHEATARLVAQAEPKPVITGRFPRWPIFCVWLACMGLLWWCERGLRKV